MKVIRREHHARLTGVEPPTEQPRLHAKCARTKQFGYSHRSAAPRTRVHGKCSIVPVMDKGSTALAHAIGARVRQQRQARRWTLDQLAESAGTSRRSLINVEQGTANPSVGILLKISDALGIGLPTLVAPPEPTRITVTRAGEAVRLWSGQFGGHGYLVTGTDPPDVVELWDWSMNPGDRHASGAHAEGTQELLHVLAGKVTVEIADQSVKLEVGDSISFPGDVDHSYGNPNLEPARFALAVYEPGVGAGRVKDQGHG